MRRLVLSFLVLFAILPVGAAQGFNPAQAPPLIYADNYGRWALQDQSANNFVLQGTSICRITQLNYGDSSVFEATGHAVTLAPVLIYDANSASAEVLTPGSAFSGLAACGWSLPVTHTHVSFSLQSGTAGLQEAINAQGQSTQPYPIVIVLDRNWYRLVSGISSLNATLAAQVTPANILAAAVCTDKVFVVDETTLPATTYGCSGGALVKVGPATVGGITVTGTPAIGDVLTATGPTAADWQLPFQLLPGLTASITGTALSASCDTGTATVTGAAVGDPVTASATTGADVGAAFSLRASVTSANTVTVYICAAITGVPTTAAYNVVVQHAVSY